jgi:hypothetical protein
VLEFSSRQGEEFSFLRVVQTGSGVHPISYVTGTGCSFSAGKAGRSPPNSAETKKMWVYTSIPPHVGMGVVLTLAQGQSYLFYLYSLDRRSDAVPTFAGNRTPILPTSNP